MKGREGHTIITLYVIYYTRATKSLFFHKSVKKVVPLLIQEITLIAILLVLGTIWGLLLTFRELLFGKPQENTNDAFFAQLNEVLQQSFAASLEPFQEPLQKINAFDELITEKLEPFQEIDQRIVDSVAAVIPEALASFMEQMMKELPDQEGQPVEGSQVPMAVPGMQQMDFTSENIGPMLMMMLMQKFGGMNPQGGSSSPPSRSNSGGW